MLLRYDPIELNKSWRVQRRVPCTKTIAEIHIVGPGECVVNAKPTAAITRTELGAFVCFMDEVNPQQRPIRKGVAQ